MYLIGELCVPVVGTVKVVLSAKLKPGKRKRGKIVGEEELTTE